MITRINEIAISKGIIHMNSHEKKLKKQIYLLAAIGMRINDIALICKISKVELLLSHMTTIKKAQKDAMKKILSTARRIAKKNDGMKRFLNLNNFPANSRKLSGK